MYKYFLEKKEKDVKTMNRQNYSKKQRLAYKKIVVYSKAKR